MNIKKEIHPQIYVFEDRRERGWLKVGFTTKENAEDRVREQFNTRLQIDKDPYILHYVTEAIDDKGKAFMDHDVHKVLTNKGIVKQGEFFQTDIGSVKSAILAVKKGETDLENRYETFSMREEQAQAVQLTKEYFEKTSSSKPEFLWNAKMRFGKTFASYQLAKTMDLKKVLVLTYKPAVEDSWKKDLLSHVDFMGWQFISRHEGNLSQLDKTKPFVYFASFQDILGTQDSGDVKVHNEWIHEEEWDLIIQDEYHYGAWRNNVKELLDSDDEKEILGIDSDDNIKETINGKYFLYLSGTPFRAINSGEFSDDQVFNWTYADEQRAKATYVGENNPYESLPEMTILTYQLPQNLKQVAARGEFDEFNLSYFFKATGEEEESEFINEAEVQKWLDLIEGKSSKEKDITNDLKRKKEKMNIDFPFSKSAGIYNELQHMIWLLPNVSSCYAMEKMLKKPINTFYKDYNIVVAAGKRGGSGAAALTPLNEAIGNNPLASKTITLTCGKLTTGVTVNPWTGIFILRALNSPESYFQSAFRVQSPWVIREEGKESIIQKEKCYVFDFDPNRALNQIATYASQLDTRDVPKETKIAEFIKFLPVIAYDGFAMEKVDAAGLLDMSIGQTTSTLLAKGWNNALLVNVDNVTLTNMVANDKAMEIINSIESYRKKKDSKVNKTIISHSKTIKKLQTKKKTEEGLNKEEKKELSQEKRDYNKKRELIREKLQTLATRIPLFMYLTDFREEKLTDVITKLQPELFHKTTGLSIEDFELLIDLGLFNSEVMNDVVYKFRNYEEASMSYSGLNRHAGDKLAGFDVDNNESRVYIPIKDKLKDSEVHSLGNKFKLNRLSKIIRDGKVMMTYKDIEFDSLESAAKYISGNEDADVSFLKKV